MRPDRLDRLKKGARVAVRLLKRKCERIGLRLLKEHFESNDPYVDDNPSARYYAEIHRKTCKDCAMYLQLLRAETHDKQMRSLK